MKRIPFFLFSTLILVAFGQTALQAQDFIVYPAKGQSQQKMQADQLECRNWAKQQTGFDPMTAGSSPPSNSQSSVGKGAVKGGAVGALGGLAIGSLSGNAGKGAAIGAVGGALIGGLSSKNRQDQARQEQQRYYQQRLDEYNRACKACLIGRGYTVQ